MDYATLLIVILGAIVVLALPIAALVNLNRYTQERSTRMLWVLTIFFMPLLGSLLYFTIERPRSKPRLM